MKIVQTVAACVAALLMVLTPSFVRAQEQEKTQAPLSQKFVVDYIAAVIGGSAIMYSDVERQAQYVLKQRQEEGYTDDRDPINEALEQLMIQKLMYNQALIDSVEAHMGGIDEAIEEQLATEQARLGSLKALEDYYRKPIYDVKEEMIQREHEMRYAQAMQSDIVSKVTITPGEVDAFYRGRSRDSLPLVPEQYMYAQITKFPPSLKEAKERVRENLIELRERILAGTRFETLARMYSEDELSAMRGGEMDPMRKDAFVTPFGDALAKLRPGQISEVVETEYGFHIIQLIDKNGNLYHCRHILAKPKFTAQERVNTVEVLDSIRKQIVEEHITFDKAALENSDDKYSKLNGGLVSNHELLEMYNAGAKYTSTRFPKEELPVNDYKALVLLKVGDISPAFMSSDAKGNEMGKILKLVRIIPTHEANINEDYLALENLALQNKQKKVVDKWLDSKIKTMYIRIDDSLKGGEFEYKGWF